VLLLIETGTSELKCSKRRVFQYSLQRFSAYRRVE
jgi:hypothetical protein